MKMQGLLVAAVVLAALSGTLYWSNHRKPAEDTSKSSADTPPKILTLNEADISGIGIRKKDVEEVVLVKADAGKWQMTAPKSLGVDSSAVSSMISTLSSLNAERVVDDKASNLNQYGLSEPALEIDVAGKSAKPRKLLIGDDIPTGNGAYAKLDEDPRVFTIASYNKTSLDKAVKDLRDKRLLTIESDKISRIQLVGKKETIEFGRNKEKWQILKPRPFRADGYQVDELVRKLTDARMDLSSSDQDPEKAFASGTMVATAKVTTESGTQEVQVRKNKDNYYAKSSVVEGMYKISNDLGQELGKNLDDFRNKKPFDFGFTNPNKIEIHDGLKAYFLRRSGEDWWSGEGKKLDAGGVGSLVDKIRDLEASKFVDSGFGAPTIEINVTSDDGKRIEKLLISKAGNSYVAKRENEPALYALDSKAVEEIQKSAGELKPAAAPGK
ncbi:MAG: hypothetical protein DMG33_17650 [Acidobacteria bacterium]|nr:MAG: hypothetical protein DMG33_17650 [Acidobacteriota bacterium]